MNPESTSPDPPVASHAALSKAVEFIHDTNTTWARYDGFRALEQYDTLEPSCGDLRQ